MEEETESIPPVKAGQGLCSELLTEFLDPILNSYCLFAPTLGVVFLFSVFRVFVVFFNSPAALVIVPDSSEILLWKPD